MASFGVRRDVFAVIAASRHLIPQARLHSQTHSGDYLVSSSEFVLCEQLSDRLVVEQRIKSRVQVTYHVRDSIRDPIRVTAIGTDHRAFLNMNLFPYGLR